MDSFMRFIKSSGIFLIGTLLAKVMIFFLLPVYTKYIPTADFGYYDLSITYLTVATSIIFFDIWSTVLRYMYDQKDVKFKYQVVLSGWSIFSVSTLGYLLLSSILFLTLDIRYLPLIILYGTTCNLQMMYSMIILGFERNVDFALSGVVNTFVMAILNITMIVGLHKDFSSMYIAGIAGNIAQIIFLEFKIRLLANIKIELFDSLLIKQMVKFTLPLCLNSMAYWLLTGYNRIVINNVMGASENGIYAVGSKFGSIIAIVTTCFTYAWQELSFSRSVNDENNGEFYSKACRMYLKFLGAGVAVLIPACYIIFPFLINGSYGASLNTIPLFLITAVISAYSSFIGNIFYALKNTKVIFISMVVSCILNLTICYPFIKLWGLNGANLSILLSFLLNIGIRAIILKRAIGLKVYLTLVLYLGVWIGVSILIYTKYNIITNGIWLGICLISSLYLFRDIISPLVKVAYKKGKKVYD